MSTEFQSGEIIEIKIPKWTEL